MIYSYALLAMLPIISALVMMTGFRIAPGKAIPAAFICCSILALAVWHVEPAAVAAAAISGTYKSMDIILTIFGAVLLLNVLKKGNAVTTINSSFNAVTRDSRIQILLVAWMFSGFIEGAAGFGAASALAAPILTGLGIPAMTAVCVSLVCNTLAVPFGAVGIPVITTFVTLGENINRTGLTNAQFSYNVINSLTAISGLSGVFIPFTAVVFAITLTPGKRKMRSIIEILPLSLFAGAAYIVPWRYCALKLGPELPSMMGAIIGIPLMLIALKFNFLVPKHIWTTGNAQKTSVPDVNTVSPIKAWMPYSVLAAILIVSRLPFLPVKTFIAEAHTLNLPELFNVKGTAVRWNVSGNPGIMPFCIISAVTALCWKIPMKDFATILKNSVKQISGAAIAIASSVALVSVMVISRNNATDIPGMPDAVAEALARLIGKYFIISSPFIGALGTFFAGSCTVSDILFVQLQFDTAAMLNLPSYIVVALQNIGGGIGSMIRLSGVIATCATVNLTGKEGKIILLNVIPLTILCILALIATAVLWGYLT